MANLATIIVTGFFTIALLLSIWFAGSSLILPAAFMIFVILVGSLCINVAGSSLSARTELMKDWEEKNPI
jgi:hypothetical protein